MECTILNHWDHEKYAQKGNCALFWRMWCTIRAGDTILKPKSELPPCPVATTISLIGSKWKLLIIRNLSKRAWRFNELQKSLEGVSQKVLTASLRELEADGIIYRKDYFTNPPKVEYGLTELGNRLKELLDVMARFGSYYKTLTAD